MPESERRMPWFAFLVYLFAAGLIFYASLGNRVAPPKQLAYSDFVNQVLNSKVEAVRVTGTELIGMAKATGENTAKDVISTPRLPSMDESWLMQELRISTTCRSSPSLSRTSGGDRCSPGSSRS